MRTTRDGRSILTDVIGAALTIAGTHLTVKEVDWYAPLLRLPVKTRTAVSGSITYGTTRYGVNSNIGYRLSWATPS